MALIIWYSEHDFDHCVNSPVKFIMGICLGGEILLEVETCYLVQLIFHILSLVSSEDDKPSKPWGGRRQNKWWNHFRYVMESCILIAKTFRRHSEANVPRFLMCMTNCVMTIA